MERKEKLRIEEGEKENKRKGKNEMERKEE